MMRAQVIVASTRAAAGVYEDTAGPIAVEFLRSLGFDTPPATVVPDARIAAALHAALAGDPTPPDVIITSGGTGVSPDDQTVDAVAGLLDRELPGIPVALWNKGLESVPTAVLSRAVAGIAGKTFIVTLPGSRSGVKDGCAVLAPLLPHLVDQMKGGHEH